MLRCATAMGGIQVKRIMRKKEYNGWFNYETWLVKLWIDNEQGTQQYWQEQAEQAVLRACSIPAEATFSTEERATLILSSQLKDDFEEAQPELTGFWADLMCVAMSEVNWHEIAASMVGDAVQAANEERVME